MSDCWAHAPTDPDISVGPGRYPDKGASNGVTPLIRSNLQLDLQGVAWNVQWVLPKPTLDRPVGGLQRTVFGVVFDMALRVMKW